jgi:tetratricopeptide (TPR) repeat protein
VVRDQHDPAEQAFQKLLADDDAAHEEVDRWIREANGERGKADVIAQTTLRARVKQRLDAVKKAYQDFLRTHPKHPGARLAYGSFLNDIQEEEAAGVEWEKARELDPKNPAAWNNLANFYGHRGPVVKAFQYYLKAIELDPTEAVYYENLATTVYLFRRDATNFFGINEAQVFEKALSLYRKALELDPNNFLLATHYAESYYGIKPAKTGNEELDRNAAQKLNEEALAAWEVAHGLARDEVEREGVLVHFARLNINGGRFEEARKYLAAITNAMHGGIKQTLTKKLSAFEAQAAGSAIDSKTKPPLRN